MGAPEDRVGQNSPSRLRAAADLHAGSRHQRRAVRPGRAGRALAGRSDRRRFHLYWKAQRPTLSCAVQLVHIRYVDDWPIHCWPGADNDKRDGW